MEAARDGCGSGGHQWSASASLCPCGATRCAQINRHGVRCALSEPCRVHGDAAVRIYGPDGRLRRVIPSPVPRRTWRQNNEMW